MTCEVCRNLVALSEGCTAECERCGRVIKGTLKQDIERRREIREHLFGKKKSRFWTWYFKWKNKLFRRGS